MTTTSGIGEEAAAAIVSACYLQLLGHAPDGEALQAHTGSLGEDAATAFPLMLRHLDGSATAERVRSAAVLGQIARPFLRRRGSKRRPAVSLGLRAYTASLLRAAGLAGESYPFDTIVASPRMLAHCLNDDFAMLLERSCYEPVPLERRLPGPQAILCGHAWYRDKFGIEDLFNHVDPTDPGEYAALQRRVEAFRDTARNAPATYVLTAPDALLWQNGFAQVSRALRAYAPVTRLLYVVVREPGAELLPKLSVVSEDEGHALVEFRSSSSWSSAGFENPLDDIVLLTAILERL